MASKESSLLMALHWYSPESDSLASSMCSDPVPIIRKRESKSLEREIDKQLRLKSPLSGHPQKNSPHIDIFAILQPSNRWFRISIPDTVQRDCIALSDRPWCWNGEERRRLKALWHSSRSNVEMHFSAVRHQRRTICHIARVGTPIRGTDLVNLQCTRRQHHHSCLVQSHRQIIFQPLDVERVLTAADPRNGQTPKVGGLTWHQIHLC